MAVLDHKVALRKIQNMLILDCLFFSVLNTIGKHNKKITAAASGLCIEIKFEKFHSKTLETEDMFALASG